MTGLTGAPGGLGIDAGGGATDVPPTAAPPTAFPAITPPAPVNAPSNKVTILSGWKRRMRFLIVESSSIHRPGRRSLSIRLSAKCR